MQKALKFVGIGSFIVIFENGIDWIMDWLIRKTN